MRFWAPLALCIGAIALAAACDGRDAKAMALLKQEVALLTPPSGITALDERTGLGEMYAEGTQTYCVADDKTGQAALDTMLRNAGWASVSTATTAEGTVWRYMKGPGLGSLTLDGKRQPCGWQFRVGVAEPL